MSVRRRILVVVCGVAVVGCGYVAAAPPGAPPAGAPPPAAARTTQPRLEDFIAEPGSKQRFQPFMLQADLWEGLDKRAKLDTIVFVLENGARCAQVMDRESTWVVDYTWVYPHNLLPPRWYDARGLIRTGDSLKLPDDADLQFTFGTLRRAVHAGSLKQATVEAYRNWPAEMPSTLRGRLRVKLDRALKALADSTAPKPPPATRH